MQSKDSSGDFGSLDYHEMPPSGTKPASWRPDLGASIYYGAGLALLGLVSWLSYRYVGDDYVDHQCQIPLVKEQEKLSLYPTWMSMVTFGASYVLGAMMGGLRLWKSSADSDLKQKFRENNPNWGYFLANVVLKTLVAGAITATGSLGIGAFGLYILLDFCMPHAITSGTQSVAGKENAEAVFAGLGTAIITPFLFDQGLKLFDAYGVFKPRALKYSNPSYQEMSSSVQAGDELDRTSEITICSPLSFLKNCFS